MMKKIAISSIVIIILIAWIHRYLYVNNGYCLSHPNYEILAFEEYNIKDKVEVAENLSYYGTNLTGYNVTVNSCRLLDYEEFCTEYEPSQEDFIYPMDSYLELSLTLENVDNPEACLSLIGLLIRGLDWSICCNSDATYIANEKQIIDADMNLSLLQGELIDIKIEFGLKTAMFRRNRWNHLSSEEMWLIITNRPVEQKVRITI